MKTPAIAFMVSALAAGCAPEEQPAFPADPAARAARLEQSGRWSEAAALYRRLALSGDPRTGEPWVKKAILACLMADRLPDAESFAAEVLKKSPQYFEVLFFLGDGQRILHRHEEARATLKKLLAEAPDHAGGNLALALVLARSGNGEEALPLFEKYLRAAADPRLRREALIEYSRALRNAGRTRQAADQLAAVLEEEPYNLAAVAESAQAFHLLGNHSLARDLRDFYLKLSRRGHRLSTEDETRLHATGPATAADRARQALQAADRREFLKAIRGLESAIEEDPRDLPALGALARLWFRLKRFREGREAIRRLEAAGGAPAEFHLLSAEAFDEIGKAEEARQALRSAVEAGQKAPAGKAGPEAVDLSEILLRAIRLELRLKGDLEPAAGWIKLAAASYPDDPRFAWCAAQLALDRGDVKTATERLESLPKPFRESSIEFRRSHALAAGLSGNLQPAAREIMALIKMAPADPENFSAFEKVFASKSREPEVARVLEMKSRLEDRRSRLATELESLASAPLAQCGSRYLALGKLAGEAGDRERALDFLSLAAELDSGDIESLSALVALLDAPRDALLRAHYLRRILERSPDEKQAIIGLIQTYLQLDLRLDEAERLALRLAGLPSGQGDDRWLEDIRSRRPAQPEAK